MVTFCGTGEPSAITTCPEMKMPLVELPKVEDEEDGVLVVAEEVVVAGRDFTGLEVVPEVPPDVLRTPLT